VSDDNVINMAKKTDCSLHVSPTMALRDAMERVGSDGELSDCKKILILFVDEREDGFLVSGLNAGMKSSEGLAVLDIAKALTLEDMGY